MNLKKLVLYSAIVFGLSGCGSSSSDNANSNGNNSGSNANDDDPPNDPFIDPDNIGKPSNLLVISPDDFEEALWDYALYFLATGDNSIFSNTSAGYEGDTGGEDDCVTTEINNAVIEAEGNTAKISMNADFKACLTQRIEDSDDYDQEESFSFSISRAKTKLFYHVECEGSNFSDLSGKTVGEVGMEALECDGAGAIVVNNEFDLEMELVINGEASPEISHIIQAISTPQNLPCAVNHSNDVFSYGANCQFVEVHRYLNHKFDDVQEYYFNMKYNDLTWEASEQMTWFTSGDADVILNNWEGTVSFTGANQAPSYVMSNGTVEKTGELDLFQPPQSDREDQGPGPAPGLSALGHPLKNLSLEIFVQDHLPSVEKLRKIRSNRLR